MYFYLAVLSLVLGLILASGVSFFSWKESSAKVVKARGVSGLAFFFLFLTVLGLSGGDVFFFFNVFYEDKEKLTLVFKSVRVLCLSGGDLSILLAIYILFSDVPVSTEMDDICLEIGRSDCVAGV